MTTGQGGTIVLGPGSGAGFGQSVVALGDVNGDNVDDFAVAAHLSGDSYAANPSLSGVGQVFVFFGGQGDLAETINLALAGGTPPDGLTYSVIQGDVALAGWGKVLAAGGDGNGDGLADVLLGAPEYNGTGQSGRGLVLYGREEWDPVIDLANLLPGEATAITFPAGPGDGLSLANLGDVDGDNFDDLIVSDLIHGRAYLWFGDGASHPDVLAVTADLGEGRETFTNIMAGHAAGDLNGDGLADIALQTQNGLTILFGSTAMGGNTRDMANFVADGTQGIALSLPQILRVESIRDINGDKIDDLLIEGREDTLSGQTISYVLFGSKDGFPAAIDLTNLDGSHGFRLPGTGVSAGLGGTGDVDGDGLRDFLLADAGAAGGAGRAFLIFGAGAAFPAEFDLAAMDGTNGYIIQGLPGDALGGGQLADVNGDGFADLILGLPGREGAAVVYGGPRRLAALDLADGAADGIIHLARLGDLLEFEEPDPIPIGGGGTGNEAPTTTDDDLLGTLGADLNIDLLAGNDRYSARDGDDLILGNLGQDTIYGDTGADTLYGGAENDQLYGGSGHDVLDGEGGADRLYGGDGDDVFHVDHSNDKVRDIANGGSDLIVSSVNFALPEWVEDLLLRGTAKLTGEGNGLNNTITGRAGANLLKGLAGWDQLSGGGGADTLVGGRGQDRLSGGGADGARDVFVFNAASESPRGGQRDVITDFQRGLDDIDLRLIDANLRKEGNQAFAFNGTVAKAYAVWWTDTGNDLLLRADVNGDKRPDLEIRLNNVPRLTASDLLL